MLSVSKLCIYCLQAFPFKFCGLKNCKYTKFCTSRPSRHFSKLSNINLILNFKQNLIWRFYQQNKCLNSNTCYVCKRIEETKDNFTKKRIKRLKRVKVMIKHKRCQKSARIKYIQFFFTTHKANLKFFITFQMNLSFFFLKVVNRRKILAIHLQFILI